MRVPGERGWEQAGMAEGPPLGGHLGFVLATEESPWMKTWHGLKLYAPDNHAVT